MVDSKQKQITTDPGDLINSDGFDPYIINLNALSGITEQTSGCFLYCPPLFEEGGIMIDKRQLPYILSIMVFFAAWTQSPFLEAMKKHPKGGQGESDSSNTLQVRFSTTDIEMVNSSPCTPLSIGSNVPKRAPSLSSGSRSPSFKQWQETERSRGRRPAIYQTTSGLVALNALDEDIRAVFHTIIRHKKTAVIKKVLRLIREDGFSENLRRFYRMPPQQRKALVYMPNRNLISPEYQVLSVKGIQEMSLQVGFQESLEELKDNGKTMYLGPVLLNGFLYAGNALVVISSQAYLLNLTLAGAVATVIEDNLKSICDGLAAGEDFFLDSVITGGFFSRLTLTPEGLAAGVLIGYVVVLGPPVIQKIIMPLLMATYKHLLTMGIKCLRNKNSRFGAREAATRLKYLNDSGLTDSYIAKVLKQNSVQETLKAASEDPAKAMKYFEILARLPQQKRNELLSLQKELDRYLASSVQEPKHSKTGKYADCFRSYFAIRGGAAAVPGIANSVYYIFCERRNGCLKAVLATAVSGGALTVVVLGASYLAPYFAVAGPAIGTLAKPALNASCELWEEEGYPNATIITTKLLRVALSDIGAFGYNTLTVATGLGLFAVNGVITYLADKLVGCGYCFCSGIKWFCCTAGIGGSDSDDEWEGVEEEEDNDDEADEGDNVFEDALSDASALQENIDQISINMSDLALDPGANQSSPINPGVEGGSIVEVELHQTSHPSDIQLDVLSHDGGSKPEGQPDDEMTSMVEGVRVRFEEVEIGGN